MDAERLLAITHALAAEMRPGEEADERAGLDGSLDRDFGLESLARAELIRRIEQEAGVSLRDALLGTAETPRDLLHAVLQAEREESGASSSAKAAAAAVRVAREPEGFAYAKTLTEVLELHLARRADQLHIRLLGDEGEEAITYRDLDLGARAVAGGLLDSGLTPHQTVALMLPTSADYFFCFLGVLLAGGIPVPIYPPARPSQLEDHLRRHAAILNNAEATMLVTVEEAKTPASLLQAHVKSLRRVVTAADLSQQAGVATPRPLQSADVAFLQYTSGSTGNPKGAVLTHANVLANLRAIGKAVRFTNDDLVVSWLPLYHDMGLIGTWLGSFYFALPLVAMSPQHFLTHPVRWLDAISRFRGTISASPNFGYELCATKLGDEETEGIDLSSWRIALNGAEPVSAETIRRFTERFAPNGLRREALTPVYGLAENALALTFPPIGRGPLIDRVQREAFTAAGVARPAESGDAGALRFVACGEPVPGHEVRVVGPGDIELPDRREGRIQFRGPSAISGYHRNEADTRRLLHDDWRDTGDLGYVDGRELYVTGRAKDIIIRAGRHVHPQEMEEAVGSVEGIRRGCVAVFGVRDRATETERVVVVAETRVQQREQRAQLEKAVRTAALDCCGAAPDEVILAPPQTVLKTSSGKIRHAATRELYERGRLGRSTVPLWVQLARLELSSLGPRTARALRHARELAYAGYALAFLGMASPLIWTSVVLTPGLSRRRALMRGQARWGLRLLGVRVEVKGRIPDGPCVIVANHESYADGVILASVLPPRIAFAAKGELRGRFVSKAFFSRVGTIFVERFDPKKGVEDAAQLEAVVRRGEAVVMFPEGTFQRAAGLLPFHMGAFLVAAQAGLPVVPITLNGTRTVLRGDDWFPRRAGVDVTIGDPIRPSGSDWSAAVELQQRVREQMERMLRR